MHKFRLNSLKFKVPSLIFAPALARVELGRLLSAAEDGDAVPAALGAPPPPEHGAAVVVVVLQRLAALRVRQADPLRLAATTKESGLVQRCVK